MTSRTVIVHHPIPENLRLLLREAGLFETRAYDGYSIFSETMTAESAADPGSDQTGSEAESKLLLTPEEAADRLSLGRTKIYQLISSGALKSVTIGKSRRIPASALVDLIDHLRAG